MLLGDKIAELRKTKNMTQADLGEELNISAQAVSKWERNMSEPDFETIKKICKLFNISINELSNQDETENKTDSSTSKLKNDGNKCYYCGKVLKEDEIFSKNPNVICNACNDERKKEAKELYRLVIEPKNHEKIQNKKDFIKGNIIAVVISALFFVMQVIVCIKTHKFSVLGIFAAVWAYTYISQLFYSSTLVDFINYFWDRDGIIFRLLITIVGLILSVVVAPFVLVKSLIKFSKQNKVVVEV